MKFRTAIMKRIILIIFALALGLTACQNDEDDHESININAEFYNLMKDYYYWYEQIPELDPNLYNNPYQLLEAIRYNPPDKWSYVTTKTELDAYYNQASYVGFGFSSGFDSNGNLIISLVYDSSPLKADGIDRGSQILSIDGQTPTSSNYNSLIGDDAVGVSKTFEFKLLDGSIQTHTYSKSEISTNSVFADTVYTYGPTKVGYFMLNSFVNPTTDELNQAFAKFQAESVSELIVDLRYNGGGLVSVANYLANLIGGNNANGGIFGSYKHNNKHEEMNEDLMFEVETYSLNIDRVFFITTKNSASASELVINSLKPFMQVVLVGSNTHGKPVGMYQFSFTDPSIDLAFVPICFSIFNANGEGDYFDGISADILVNDDITHLLGDTQELCINAALTEIGVVSKNVTSHSLVTFNPIIRSGLKGEIGSF